MILNLRIIKVNHDYCDYLRQFDDKVPYNQNNKQKRPFVGVLFKVNNIEYFAPLSSPKPKHLKMKNTIDFFKINCGKLGVVNFNNMIPINIKNYKIIYFIDKPSTKEERIYQDLLKDQLSWLNKNYIQVINKSSKLYNLYINDKLPKNIKSRCCNFKLLEEKCNEYNLVKV